MSSDWQHEAANVFNAAYGRAQKRGRLPHDAQKVLEEITTKLKSAIRKTPLQREDRLDKEFEALKQGNSTHAEFRALFGEKLDEVEDAKMDLVESEATIRRKYLSKLNLDLRATVLSKTWPLGGEERPSRRPTTWVEVATAVELELESRADSRAPAETLHRLHDAAGGGDGGEGVARSASIARGPAISQRLAQREPRS